MAACETACTEKNSSAKTTKIVKRNNGKFIIERMQDFKVIPCVRAGSSRFLDSRGALIAGRLSSLDLDAWQLAELPFSALDGVVEFVVPMRMYRQQTLPTCRRNNCHKETMACR